jgi:aspartate/tyrosine/aromatic aminotransferase
MSNLNNRGKQTKESLLEISLEKVKMCKSELRKNIVSLLMENEKLKKDYHSDVRQYKVTIRNLEKNMEKIEKELAEKNKEISYICDEIDCYELPEELTDDRKQILLELMLVLLCGILIYNACMNILFAWIIY